VIDATGRTLAIRLPVLHQALGGGGLGHWIIRLFIWHEIWRLIRYVWHIHTFGPFLTVAIVLVIIGFIVWQQQRGPGSRLPWQRRGDSGGATGHGSGSGPRDW
jgi:hypothetical protein